MKVHGYIYLIKNKINGKLYIGQTINSPEERFSDHYFKSYNSLIKQAMRKYGRENFLLETIAVCFDQEALNEAEIELIASYNSLAPNGYNLRTGGTQGGKCSEITKGKISKSKTGKTIDKLKGRKKSEEEKLKISKSLGGKLIKATNLKTGEVKIYQTAHSTKYDGFFPWNVISCCKGKRKHSLGWKFEYYANQTGSSGTNNPEHGQRIEIETTKVE